MLKTILLSVHTIGVFLVGALLLPKEVKIEHNIPSQIIAGESHWVYIDIDKNKINGFAKYQMDVPDGFEVEPGDLKGATFTFSNGAAKIIWMALPNDSEFQVSIKLRATETCPSGNYTFSQRFAYVEDNDRKTTELEDHVLFVGEQNVSNQFVPDDLASGSRRITRLNGDHFLVEMDLYKDGIKGFAKIEETLPAGLSAEPVKKSNAVFTQLDNTVKFVWFSIPEQDSLTIVYELFADESTFPQFDIRGAFTYLKDNESRTVDLDTKAFEASESVAMEEEVQEESPDLSELEEASIEEVVEETIEEVVEEPLTEIVEETSQVINEVEESIEEPVVEEVEPIIEEPITRITEVSNIPSPDEGVSYRVQVAAGKNVVDEAYFKKRHKFTEGVDIEHQDSWVKYTTGSHPVYKAARDERVRIRDNYNFDGPFVTAYSDGERITVQEALMITRQQWYQ